MIPTSNHNKLRFALRPFWVVYLLIPTSNHNDTDVLHEKGELYIFWFLHQTTTCLLLLLCSVRCISFDSYIKPQLLKRFCYKIYVVYLLIPTSNHNRNIKRTKILIVVYLLIPTSNHNFEVADSLFKELYIFWFLHQTTTCQSIVLVLSLLYIFWFLHQTTTQLVRAQRENSCISFDSYIKPQLKMRFSIRITVVYLLIPTSNHNFVKDMEEQDRLYIFWFLHQTTTTKGLKLRIRRCISFDSYIKPQLIVSVMCYFMVVYLLIPTSNHNSTEKTLNALTLYIFWFLHQTTTPNKEILSFMKLYIFWFLHQTTTLSVSSELRQCCISFDSYIKPQLKTKKTKHYGSCISFDSYIKPQLLHYFFNNSYVVYLLIPTSNHNYISSNIQMLKVVYLLIPTSNHNAFIIFLTIRIVVYLLIPTSNHNWYEFYVACALVVYLLIPTSNHNCIYSGAITC